MRVGMVTACYKPVVNGVTRMVCLYQAAMEALGHEVTIFTLGQPEADDDPSVVRTPGVPLGESGYYFNVRYSRAAQERLRQMDILHCHHLMMGVELAYRYGTAPIVYTNHTRLDLYTGALLTVPQPAADAIMRLAWPRLTALCDVVVAPSVEAKAILRRFGVRRPIEVIPNGIDLSLFRGPGRLERGALGLPASGPLFVYVGRLAREKNVARLLAEFERVRRRMPAAHLVLVGHGPQAASLRQLAARHGLAGAVRFAGSVPHQEVPHWLALADIFVTASVTEVHPLALIEALAAGLPIVAVDSPGTRPLVQAGRNGELVGTQEGALAQAMLALAADPARCRHYRQEALAASQRYDIHHTVRQTVELYDRLCRRLPSLPLRML